MDGKRDKQLIAARAMMKSSDRIVCLLGVGMDIESGIPNLWSNDTAYYLEDKYGYSLEEMYSATFLNTRPAKFYEYYKELFLEKECEPCAAFKAVSMLEKKGKIKGCITESISGLAKRSGISNIIELHGNIDNNWCPKCKKKYTKQFILSQENVPLCNECKATIRPGIILTGEQVRNDYMTYAANMAASADMLLVLGTNMNDNMVKWVMNYFTGEHVLVISKNIHFSDNRANLVINEEVQEVLPQLIEMRGSR